MPDTDSITIVKDFNYQEGKEEYSNTYHLEGITPTNDAGWQALALAVFAAEKPALLSEVRLLRAYGYVAGNDNSVSTIDFVALGGTLQTGSLTIGSNEQKAPGDAAVWVRMKRAERSSKGKNVYCRKYIHPAVQKANADRISDTQKAGLIAMAGKMTDGTLPGGMKWCAPQGGDLSQAVACNFVTTRTLKRRGKRPSS